MHPTIFIVVLHKESYNKTSDQPISFLTKILLLKLTHAYKIDFAYAKKSKCPSGELPQGSGTPSDECYLIPSQMGIKESEVFKPPNIGPSYCLIIAV